MAFNRELSQFASFLELDAGANFIGITSSSASTKVGIGTALPDSKFVVVGDARITGIVTAANFKVSGEGRFEGPLTGNVTGNVTGNLTGEVNAAAFDTNASGVVVTGVTTSTSFSGTNLNITNGQFTNLNVTGIATINGTNVSAGSGVTITSGGINVTGVVTALSFNGPLTGNVTGNVTGNSSTASALQTARTISITGDVAGSVSFDGSSNVSIAATIQPNSVALGSDTTGNYVATVADAGSSDIVVSGSGSETAAVTLGLSTTGVVAGSYGSTTSILTITVDSRGRLTSVGTASVGTALTVAGDSGSENINLLTETLIVAGGTNLTSSAAGNTITVNLDPGISLTNVNATGIVTASQFVTGASGQAIGINTNTISGPSVITIDPAGVGDNTGAVRIKGDLFVDGVQTVINSTTIELADFIVGIASTATTDTLADGAGIKIGPDNTLTYDNANTALKSSENFNLASGKSYKINGVDVLSATSLSITNVNASGVVTATSGFSGNLTGNVTGNVTGNSSTASALQTARTISITGDVAGSVSFDGSSNVSIAATIQPNSVALGGDTTGNYVATVADAGSSDIVVSGSGSETAAVTLGLSTTGVVAGSYGSSTSIPTFTVDSRGRLTAAGTASVGTALTVAGDSGSENINLLTETLTVAGGTNLTSSAASNTVTINLDNNISLTSVVASGVVTATSGFSGNLTGNVTGNSSTASALQTARTIAITGDVAGSVSFDGSSNVSIAATIQPNSVALGGDTTGNYVATVADAGSSDIVVSGSGSETAAVTLGLSTTGVTAGSYGSSTSIPTFTVDSRGRLTAAGTASVGTALTVAGDSGSENINLLSETLTITGGTNLTSSAASNTVTVNLDPNISLTSVVASGVVTAAQFVTGASGQAIGISTNVISGPDVITIDPAAVGDNTGAVRIKGDLYVDGAQFFVNSGTIELADFIVGVATTASTNAVLDGAGIGIGSANVRKTLTWNNTSNSLKSSENLDLLSGKSYKINGTEVLSANSLTITNVNAAGVVTATTFVGNLTGEVNAASFDTNASGVIVTGVATATSFSGPLTGNVTGNVTGNLAGNVNATSGISTFNNIEINGTLTDVNNSTGTNGYILVNTGAGVSWSVPGSTLPNLRTTSSQTATSGQTSFTVNYTVGYLDIYVNGVKLAPSEFTATNGTTVTLGEAAFAGDNVEFYAYNTATYGGSINSLNDLSDVTLTSSSNGQLLQYNGSEWVNSSSLVGINSVDATTVATLETALGFAPNTFNSLFISNTGISTFTGAVNANTTLTVTGQLTCANVNSSGIVTATDFNSSSDRNLKDNIRVIENASELVGKLEGVHFTWKSSGAETCGVIAQQIEEYLPQLVHTGEDHKTVNYNGLVGVLIAAVREQGEMIAALKAEIEELKK